MKIGILQTGHAPDEVKGELGDYATMFARLLQGHGFDYETFNVVDNEFPTSVDAADGWLITGSKHGVYEDHDWIAPLESFIRDVKASGKPMIGVCFGHQIIAQALGGQVEKFDGGWIAGPQSYRFGGDEVVLNAWHQDQVITPPEGAKVLASNDSCANAALLYGDTILTVQPHPEFTTRMMEGLLQHRAPGVLPETMIQQITDQLGQPQNDHGFAHKMAAFFKGNANE
ncbi:GMP synthase [glutamine-hydrolyzing] [Thalassovita gelatinovora]|uniref:GMP synthase [glutamine-hydrolyzing] n=1 Tax=Thalassovita gelatinovora TaxID=53501 RepID=A0A0P1FIS6_THAGE|nr:type 1 glutamine amidotransferase [Thalassovita gelatinovora]QIZ82134.1 type 1 glutamine amidotransferase [Thalassovita gelatinovora]CUH67711.1 GMP synthase [glutamine-hydrolyzing] [Thalassovita gelatinovora]SEP68929.1 GMP synthase (glutamine-hydrolysing) [Thalassovita gelatinovora]